MEEDHDQSEANDWEHIPAPWRANPSSSAAAAVPEESEGSAPTIELGNHQLVDDYCSISVFPPINHEGLAVPPTELLETPSVPPLEAAPVRSKSGGGGMMKLRQWVVGTLLSCRRVRLAINYCGGGGRVWYSLLLCIAGALSAWRVYRRVQGWSRRDRVLARPRGGNQQDQLALLIKEKDEKINELLVRVSQMNQVLHAQRKVPVFRINSTS